MSRAGAGAGGAAAVALLALLVPALLTGCAAGAPGAARPATSASAAAAQRGPEIRVVSPEGAVRLGDEVRLVVQATVDGVPLKDRVATFEVISGPAAYPGGFETSSTDADGVASSLGLQAQNAGEVTVRVAVGEVRTDLVLDVAGS
ncbi:hypothetical protein LXM50_15055 [Microbacterium sp. Au-Mic1]|uniref:hypothetical protein n=1 Tax=Microbacterium sp. Au-Mic1 TaxID=2906457 RepID=UPI001E4C213B|nr:hypothetical protein [Microbacterium sp. Au-Mic1]MCE4027291.1 hypothetical protein [Microbacterium sp. Au-Mic1]